MFTNYNFELKIVFDSSFYAKIMITFIYIHTYMLELDMVHTYIYMYMPGSLYAICRAHRLINGLCGWRMRSHACISHSIIVYDMVYTIYVWL